MWWCCWKLLLALFLRLLFLRVRLMARRAVVRVLVRVHIEFRLAVAAFCAACPSRPLGQSLKSKLVALQHRPAADVDDVKTMQ